tara:strand:- start:1897 stop:2493 length:597 start_codon:yes stop_codon:yes gene_type:complete
MYLCQKEKFKPPGKLKKSVSSNNLKVDEIGRFQNAYATGLKSGVTLQKTEDGKKYKMDRSGVNFMEVIKEINNSAIKKKQSHYIWYIFPQPVFKPKSGSFQPSTTSKFFYITNKETRMFLEDVNLATRLLRVLNALVNKNFNPLELQNYFSPNGDDKKFKSFRTHFKKIIREMKPRDTDSQGKIILEISEKLGELEIN